MSIDLSLYEENVRFYFVNTDDGILSDDMENAKTVSSVTLRISMPSIPMRTANLIENCDQVGRFEQSKKVFTILFRICLSF